MPRLIRRIAISIGIVAAISAVCLRLPHVDYTTLALFLILVNVGLARMWGRAEALTGAILGGIVFEYYLLLHRSSIASPEHLVSLAAFLITAVATGQLAAHSERRRVQAVERQGEVEKMYGLVNAILERDSSRSSVSQLADKLVEIFGVSGVALCDKHTGLIVRSGPHADTISDEALRAVTRGYWPGKISPGFALVPIHHGDELVGSLGLSGRRLSDRLLSGIAGRVGLALARLYAIETTTEAEVVRRSEELKSAVLDAMAHDIRNPLHSIKLAATALLSGRAGSELQKRELLTIIGEELDRMDRSIDEAVRLTRIEATELSLNKEPQNMAQLVPAAVAEMGVLASRRPIRMSVPASLPPAECDKGLITGVLKQLLGNALKYSPDGSPLTVSAKFTGAAIVIDVVDQGPGVEIEERDRIFEKYYRGRAARPGTPGTGLGLASARSILQAHGGEIWVTNPPAGGAAFHIALPATSSGNGAASL